MDRQNIDSIMRTLSKRERWMSVAELNRSGTECCRLEPGPNPVLERPERVAVKISVLKMERRGTTLSIKHAELGRNNLLRRNEITHKYTQPAVRRLFPFAVVITSCGVVASTSLLSTLVVLIA